MSRGVSFRAHEAHDRRFADGQGFDIAGAWPHCCGNEDDAHSFRRQRGRVPGRRDGKAVPCGAAWSMFICPRCNGRAQRLRLLDDRPACGKCVRASGLIYRSQSIRTEKRHLVTAPPRLAMLNSDRPLRVHPRAGRTIDGRANLEFALRRSRIVARKHGVDRAKDQGL